MINLESFLDGAWTANFYDRNRTTGGWHGRSSEAARWVRWLEGLIFFFLILFAILLPHSIKGARHAWMAAGLLWLAKLAIERKRPFPQALSAPLLAYIVLSGISTALSPDPYLSWPRMKVVCLVLAGIVVAQNLQRLSQVRILVLLLLLSGLAAAGFTAWQYTYGVGVQVKYLAPTADLYRAGFTPATSLPMSTAALCILRSN